MSTRLVKGNEIESITALAAKSFAGVLEAEKREKTPMRGRTWVDSVADALSVSPEDLTWNAIGHFEDERPGSFATIWERVKEYARDELESGQREDSVAIITLILHSKFKRTVSIREAVSKASLHREPNAAQKVC